MNESSSHSFDRLRRQTLGSYRYVRLRWRLLFALIDAVGTLLFGVARAVRRIVAAALGGSPQRPAEAEDPRVILLVQLDHLGDAIISTVMLPALRRRYPQASIEVLASQWNREVFEAMPEVDRVYVSRLNRFARGARLHLAWMASTIWWGLRLRRRHVNLGIDVRGEFPLALILWLCGARRRLGWACGGGRFLLTDSPRFLPGRPEVESRWAMLAELGIQPPQQPEKGVGSLLCEAPCGPFRQKRPDPFFFFCPQFSASPQARQRVSWQLQQLDEECPRLGPRIVVHVGAGTQAKQWPVAHWQELIGRMVTDYGAQIILVGGRSDGPIALQILAGRDWPGVADWTGRCTLLQLAALLEQADLSIGADSGPAHLAAAVGTPAIVLFSGTNGPSQWKPCGPRVIVLRHPVACGPCHRQSCAWPDHPCMTGLRPDVVAAALGQVLREKSRMSAMSHACEGMSNLDCAAGGHGTPTPVSQQGVSP